MRRKIFVFWLCSAFLTEIPACVGSPDRVSFSLIERHAFASDPRSSDQLAEYNAINASAKTYLNDLFPPGYPVRRAVAAVELGGAACRYFNDPADHDPTSYVCDFNRPGYGLGYFFIQIDWIVDFNFDQKTGLIVSIDADREETGL